MRRLLASVFAIGLLALTALAFVPGASARDGGDSCFVLHDISSAYNTPANYQSNYHSELNYERYC
jgi:hypothetical protein